VYCEELFKIIAISGGFFTTKLFPERVQKTLNTYIRRKNNCELVSSRRRTESGFLYKLPDEVISKYYHLDARKRYRILTTKGFKEFSARVNKYVGENCKDQLISNHYKKDWYNEIYQEVLNDKRFANYSRYNITDYKLFVCFTRILARIEFGFGLIPKKREAEFRKKHNLLHHSHISTGITFGYNYASEKVVVLVSDFVKSDKSLLQILTYYSRNEFEIIIYTLRPAELLEKRLRAKYFKEWHQSPSMTVINDPFLNKFFGDYYA
jgi:hypothetical protein